MQVTTDLTDLLLQAVYQASEAIMEVYKTDFQSEIKEDKTPVTKADKLSSEILTRALKETGIVIVSEEEKNPLYKDRHKSKNIWLVDPLDGTKEFIRRNDEFCINIGLIENSNPVFGLIASPVKKEVLIGGPGFGVYHFPFFEKNFKTAKFQVSRLREKKSRGLIFSRSHFNEQVNLLVTRLEERYGPMHLIKRGSALKFFDLATGVADFYPRTAPTMEWDIAAGHAIYNAVGGEVLDFTTFEPLVYNKPDLVNPHFIAKPVTLRIN